MFDIIYMILNSFFDDYINLKNTNCIRGIFVWMIFFRHFREYCITKKGISLLIDASFGQNIVSLFLFYSGFGINESFKIKGLQYIKTLPIKSLVLIVKAEIILIIFLFNNIFLGIKVSLKSYLKAIIFKSGIGNSYWFVLEIIFLYFYSYLSFIFIKKIICSLHINIIYKYYHPKLTISVDTIYCFIIGFYYSFFRLYLETFIMKSDKNYFGIIVIFILIYYQFKYALRKNIYTISIKNCTFTIIIILISMKIKFNNEFLNLLNKHSFTIYLLQRVVMIHIFERKYLRNNVFIRFFFEFILVIFVSDLFDNYFSFIEKSCKYLLSRSYKKKNKNIN